MTCRHCPGLTQVTRSVTRAAGLSPASGVSGPPSPQLPRGEAIVARVSQSAGPAPRHFCGLSCWTPLGNCAPVGSSQPPAAQPPRDADGRLPAVPSAHAPSQPRGAVSSVWHTCKAAAAETGQRDSVPQSSMGGRRGPKLRLWGQWRSSPSLSRANRKHFGCVPGTKSRVRCLSLNRISPGSALGALRGGWAWGSTRWWPRSVSRGRRARTPLP